MALWSAWAAHGEAVARRARDLPGDSETASGLAAEARTTGEALGSQRLVRALDRHLRDGLDPPDPGHAPPA